MKLFLLIHTTTRIIGILTFTSGKNSILGLSEPKKQENPQMVLHLPTDVADIMIAKDVKIKNLLKLFYGL